MTLLPLVRAPFHARLDGLPSVDVPRPDAGTAVLLLHGFTGTPYELRRLARGLGDAGMHVEAPALRGHAGHPLDMRGVRWRDWAAEVRGHYRDLRRRFPQVVVAGLSMGAALSRLLLDEEQPPERLLLLAIPHRVLDPLGRVLLPILRPFPFRDRWVWAKDGGSDLADPRGRFKPLNYRWAPLGALSELDDLLRRLRFRGRPATVPTLMLHGLRDWTAPPSGGREVLRRLGSQARMFVLPRSGHVLTRDVDAERVAELAAAFLGEAGRWPASGPGLFEVPASGTLPPALLELWR